MPIYLLGEEMKLPLCPYCNKRRLHYVKADSKKLTKTCKAKVCRKICASKNAQRNNNKLNNPFVITRYVAQWSLVQTA